MAGDAPFLDSIPTGVELGAASDLAGSDGTIDDELRDLLGGEGANVRALFDARDHVPRVRPILVALSARTAGALDVDRHALHAAELLHLALSVHDLALGQQGGRRRRVARSLAKRSVGWLAGNQVALRALELTRHTSNVEIMGDVVDTLRSFAEGQGISRDVHDGHIPNRDDWLEHADATTGALFSFCCRAGAHLAGGDPATVSTLGRYGRHLGRMWHVAEDLSALRLGNGTAHLLGRACAGRPVLPLILATEIDASMGAAWAALVNDPTAEAAELLVHQLSLVGGVSATRRIVARESWAAQRLLTSLPDSPHRRALTRLAVSLAKPSKRDIL